MANSLTGDFEVVLQISARTLRRLVANMHQNAFVTAANPSIPHVAYLRLEDGTVAGQRGSIAAQIGAPHLQLIHGVSRARARPNRLRGSRDGGGASCVEAPGGPGGQAAVASSSRILEIINSPVTVHISGVGYSHVIPGVGAIADRAGLTRSRESPEQPISIWYDITDAAGRHWTVKDKDRQDIYLPRQVLPYHELAHAYHNIKGDEPAADHDREVQASPVSPGHGSCPADRQTRPRPGAPAGISVEARHPPCSPRRTARATDSVERESNDREYRGWGVECDRPAPSLGS